MTLPCPACGFLTIQQDSYGSYLICPICNWEDDPWQLANPALGGGANIQSLVETQRTVILNHPLTETNFGGIKRDSSWRPLSADERERAEAETQIQGGSNESVYKLSEVYWRRLH